MARTLAVPVNAAELLVASKIWAENRGNAHGSLRRLMDFENCRNGSPNSKRCGVIHMNPFGFSRGASNLCAQTPRLVVADEICRMRFAVAVLSRKPRFNVNLPNIRCSHLAGTEQNHTLRQLQSLQKIFFSFWLITCRLV